jgi:predicted permease
VSDAFANLISGLLVWAMLPLALVFSMDAYLVAKIASKSTGVALAVGGILALVFAGAWLVFPRVSRRRNEGRRSGAGTGNPA